MNLLLSLLGPAPLAALASDGRFGLDAARLASLPRFPTVVQLSVPLLLIITLLVVMRGQRSRRNR